MALKVTCHNSHWWLQW